MNYVPNGPSYGHTHAHAHTHMHIHTHKHTERKRERALRVLDLQALFTSGSDNVDVLVETAMSLLVGKVSLFFKKCLTGLA